MSSVLNDILGFLDKHPNWSLTFSFNGLTKYYRIVAADGRGGEVDWLLTEYELNMFRDADGAMGFAIDSVAKKIAELEARPRGPGSG